MSEQSTDRHALASPSGDDSQDPRPDGRALTPRSLLLALGFLLVGGLWIRKASLSPSRSSSARGRRRSRRSPHWA